MEIPDELIECFFNNACSAAEAEMVVRRLQENPRLLERYAGREDWDEAATRPQLPQTFTEDMWQAVSVATRPARWMVWLRKTAVAAGVSGLLFLGYKLADTGAGQNADSPTGKMEMATAITVRHHVITNSGRSEMRLVLPDGSRVRLETGRVVL
jgi:hypothetical protein